MAKLRLVIVTTMRINAHRDVEGVGMGRTVSSKAVILALEKAGWREVEQVGSHKHFKHPTLQGKTTVPHPKRELAIGTIKSIERQSGLKLR